MSLDPPAGPEQAPPPPDVPLPWPLSQVDTSPSAVRRRGLAFFHAVALLMGGGIWALVPGPWVIVAGLLWLLVASYSIRRYIPTMVTSLSRMEAELTRLYARIEDANTPKPPPEP
jgi:hypothetical protein